MKFPLHFIPTKYLSLLALRFISFKFGLKLALPERLYRLFVRGFLAIW